MAMDNLLKGRRWKPAREKDRNRGVDQDFDIGAPVSLAEVFLVSLYLIRLEHVDVKTLAVTVELRQQMFLVSEAHSNRVRDPWLRLQYSPPQGTVCGDVSRHFGAWVQPETYRP